MEDILQTFNKLIALTDSVGVVGEEVADAVQAYALIRKHSLVVNRKEDPTIQDMLKLIIQMAGVTMAMSSAGINKNGSGERQLIETGRLALEKANALMDKLEKK